MVQIYKFKCSKCDYCSTHALGTTDPQQSLTDVNTEFAEYRLFRCNAESRLIHADVYEKQFKNLCPSDSSLLVEVDPGSEIQCPRCQNILDLEITSPLSVPGESA